MEMLKLFPRCMYATLTLSTYVSRILMFNNQISQMSDITVRLVTIDKKNMLMEKMFIIYLKY